MGKVVILGHGDFKPGSGPKPPPEVLIPPNTTLQFYSNAGQALVLPRAKYEPVAEVWTQLQAAETDHGAGPLKQGQVTYNFRLTPDDTDAHRDSAQNAKWGAGTQVHFIAKGETLLCTGGPETCPTPVLNVVAARHQELKDKVLPKLGSDAQKHLEDWIIHRRDDLPDELLDFIVGRLGSSAISADYFLTDVLRDEYDKFVAFGVPAGAWDHDCDGILKKFAGNEIHWIACTAFQVEGLDREIGDVVAQLPALDTADVSGPGKKEATWEPGRGDEGLIYRNKNKANLETLKMFFGQEKAVAVVAAGNVALIGTEHGREAAEYVRGRSDKEEGQIKISIFGNRLDVPGITSEENRNQVVTELNLADEFDKLKDWKVRFTSSD